MIKIKHVFCKLLDISIVIVHMTNKHTYMIKLYKKAHVFIFTKKIWEIKIYIHTLEILIISLVLFFIFFIIHIYLDRNMIIYELILQISYTYLDNSHISAR